MQPELELQENQRLAYQEWLQHPMTQRVFAIMERQGRPSALPGASAEGHSYALGVVTGWWAALDAMRSLDGGQEASPVPKYEPPR